MKASYLYLILTAVIAALHLPIWYAIVAAPWLLFWAFYRMAKGD